MPQHWTLYRKTLNGPKWVVFCTEALLFGELARSRYSRRFIHYGSKVILL
jgi:hypothetical protein